MDLKFQDNIMRKASRLEEESLGCLVERDGYIAIAAQVKLSLIFCRSGEIIFHFLPLRWNWTKSSFIINHFFIINCIIMIIIMTWL